MSRPSRTLPGVLAGVVVAALFVAYPVLVWWGLSQGRPRTVALVMLAVVVPLGAWRWYRATKAMPAAVEPDGPSGKASVRSLALLPLVTVIALGLGAALDRAGYVLAVPSAINFAFLMAFGATLARGRMPMIERFARLQDPDLDRDKQRWCRTWTWIWCGFFVVNGSAAAVLALAAPLSWWAFYTGLLSYGLMGLLFAAEWLLRRRRFG